MVHAAAHGGRLSGRFGFRRHRGTAARSRLRVFRQLHGGRHPALLDYGLRPAAHAAHVALLLRDGYAVLHVFPRSGQGERARADAGALGKLGRRAGRRAGVGKAVHICDPAVPHAVRGGRAVLDRLMRAVTGGPDLWIATSGACAAYWKQAYPADRTLRFEKAAWLDEE